MYGSKGDIGLFIGKWEAMKSVGLIKRLVVLIILLLQGCVNCSAGLSWNSLNSVSIKYSVLAGGLLARRVSGMTVPATPLRMEIPQVTLRPEATSSNGPFGKGNQFSDAGQQRAWRHRTMKSDREKVRLQLLKQIKSLDHMKCFPKVLCGLSVDSSKSSSGIDSHLVRSYIQLMRSANPEDDSSEEGKPRVENTKDALSLFLMKSGIIESKVKSGEDSGSASSSNEQDYQDLPSQESSGGRSPEYKSPFERNRQELEKIILSKRVLDTRNKSRHRNDQDEHSDPTHYRPVLYMTPSSMSNGSSTSSIGSVVSSWVPWLSFSLGTDSFEKDPFFTPGTKNIPKKGQVWENEMNRLRYLIKLKEAVHRRKKKTSIKKRITNRSIIHHRRNSKDLKDDEMVVYATAVEIGQKLKDPKQCDYLYNGCPVPYLDIIKIISSIRKDFKEEEETIEALSQEMFGTDAATPLVPKRRQSLTKRKHSQSQSINRRNKAPMTKISHTLPNGEKVEINVQVSGKDGLAVVDKREEFEDETPQEEEEYVESGLLFGKDYNIPETEVEEEPAISTSYELDDELQDDFRKPTPLEIFNKISLKSTEKPVVFSTSPRYTVSKRAKAKPRRTTTTTTTTKRPLTTRKPSTSKTPQTTTSTRPPASRRPSKPVKIPTAVNPKTNVPHTIQAPPAKRNKRPSTDYVRTTKPSTTSTSKPSIRTTQPTTKVMSRKPEPSTVDTHQEMKEWTTPGTISSSTNIRPKPFMATTEPATTEPALAIFTTTTNFMMDYTVKELSTTEGFKKPAFSTLAPVINRYSLFKKSKPGSLSVPGGTSVPVGLAGLGKLATFNLEYNSSEINVPIGSYISRDDPQRVVTFMTTTAEPKLFPDISAGTSSNVAGGKKRKINYKNAKLPHLVLMTVSAFPTPTLSEGSGTIIGNGKDGKPSRKPQYSFPPEKTNNNTSSVEYLHLQPQVFQSGGNAQGDPHFSPWSPNP